MSNAEYVARVVVERVERRAKEVVVRGRTAVSASRERIVTEVASFTIRDADMVNLATRIMNVLPAALPDTSVRGEETNIDDGVDEEDETF